MYRLSREIILTKELSHALKGADNLVKQDFLKEIFVSGVFYTLLLDYEYGKGNLQNISAKSNSIEFTSSTAGFLYLGYDINEFSMCAAIDYTTEYTMKIDFKIDYDTNKIIFTGEERYERQDEL
ncbi:hypothetical protein ACVWYN_002053 [Pedobacter sp. UYP24]